MESRRIALIAVLGVILYLIYTAWITDHPPPAPPIAAAAPSAIPADPAAVPVPAAPAADGSATASTPAGDLASTPPATSQTIHVKTDLVDAEFATAGAELRRVELSQYALDKKNPDVKLPLLNDRDGVVFTLQSGLAAIEKALPGNNAVYATPQTRYELPAGVDTLDVPFEYTDAAGFTLKKVFRFKRGSYQIELVQTVVNHTGGTLNVSPYARWLRNPVSAEKAQKFIVTFLGLGIYEQKPNTTDYRFKKLKLDTLNEKPYESKQTGGWMAMIQHYFIAAIIPPADEAATYTGKPAGNGNYLGQYLGATKAVADGSEAHYSTGLYIGPKLQGTLDDVAKGLALTEDYGILTVIAKPLFVVMSFFHGIVGNWGWSIILLTVLVKLLFYPLTAAQYKSMAKMKKFTPRIAELKERYADDREKLSRAMMDLYKKEGFNPLAGCWPILVQMPVFFSLYWVLIESVELRQAPFVLWLQDLSAADPLYITPVLYGASMWLQQRLSGQLSTMDPMQARIMNVMPIAFTGMFLFFPAGLVVYWFVSNVIGIAQQLVITKRIEAADAASRALKKA
ncbi:MAG: membrane protein insertase YidC [Gammaproteobacteria bacterium]|jgi:YidC/Oxa1 family membrane protein insertase|uniref:membrane protein insertase YidC n=1 Tax=Nevskia sp. TaxID=1929292 RepID=UPI0040364C8C|nr:membrane protein insertase YidC [Gammaproteobacteria bacterium]